MNTATVAGSPYTITPSGATGTGVSNYTISYVNGSFTVNTAPLTITAPTAARLTGQRTRLTRRILRLTSRRVVCSIATRSPRSRWQAQVM